MRSREKEYQRRRQTPQDTMLADFLRAKTPHEKRSVIASFAPFYYLLTPTPTELKKRKEQHEQQVEV